MFSSRAPKSRGLSDEESTEEKPGGFIANLSPEELTELESKKVQAAEREKMKRDIQAQLFEQRAREEKKEELQEKKHLQEERKLRKQHQIT